MDELTQAIHLLTELILQKGRSILLKEREEKKRKAAELMSRVEKGDC